MGQTVEIRDKVNLGDMLLIDTDRSFTGQDGQEMTRESLGDGVPSKLASALFESDTAINHVFVLQNTVSIKRDGAWDTASANAAGSVTANFLRFYED